MTKNLKAISILSTLMLSLLIGVNNSSAATLATTLKGRILLQVESKGEAWYVNPANELRYYLGRPADALNIMKELGLGITNKDFDSFNVDNLVPSRLSGRILLKVGDNGKAYYVNPLSLRMYYLGSPSQAFYVMRDMGLGITDKNLSLINRADMVGWKTYADLTQGVSFKYPSSWTFQKFSCNLDGVAFCPLLENKPSNCGMTCSLISQTSIPVIFYQYQGDVFSATPQELASWTKPHLALYDSKYKGTYDEMISSFMLTKPTNQAASWKTYQSENYGFQFKYPSEIVFQPKYTDFISLIDGVEADIPDTYNLPNSFQHFQKIYVGLTSATSVAQCMPGSNNLSPELQGIATPMTINGITFNKYQINGDCAMDGCGVGNIYASWNNGKCYRLSSFAIQASPSKAYDGPTDPRTIAAEKDAETTTKRITELTEKILSTFKFTDPTNATAGWKTYINNQYEFQINFPSDWKINDQSYIYNNVKSALLEISSPTRLEVSGNTGTRAQFSLQLIFNKKVTVGWQKFIKAYKPGDQAVTDILLDNSILQNTNEYQVAQKIIKSATIISN